MNKNIERKIARILVYLAYVLTYMFPIRKKKATFISYFSHGSNDDFDLLKESLQGRGKKVVINARKFKGDLRGKFLYLLNFLRQTYEFNTSKLIVLDGNNFVHNTIKVKPKVRIVQIWHASGAVKKFGQEHKRRYKIKGYKFLVASSMEMGKILAKHLNTNGACVYPLGIAKSDLLFDEEIQRGYKEEIEALYPRIIGKKVILFAPTFRGNGLEDMVSPLLKREDISLELGDEYVILNKEHPLSHKERESDKFIDVSTLNLYKLFAVADFVVSDYSAIVFDAMAMNKEVIFYCPDILEYEREVGLNFDLEAIPFPFVRTKEEFCDLIRSYEVKTDAGKTVENELLLEKQREFKMKYIKNMDGNSTKRISEFLIHLMEKR